MQISILLVEFLLAAHLILPCQSVSGTSAFANTVKYKAPKLEKTSTGRKNKVATDGDAEVDSEEGRCIEFWSLLIAQSRLSEYNHQFKCLSSERQEELLTSFETVTYRNHFI